MEKFIFLICFLLLVLSINLKGQKETIVKRKCATEEVHNHKMQTDTAYRNGYIRAINHIKKFILENPNYKPKQVVTIPVVFHIVLSPEQHQQFPDLRVYEQIEVLNRDFAGQNPNSIYPFDPSLKANTEIQFCLATIDPNGNPTTGIERRDYTGGPWGTNPGIKHYSQGGLDAWDPNRYLNIWVGDLGDGLCGYALFPTIPLSNEFGLVTHWEFTGLTGAVPPYHLGGTVTHEIGHCFSLKHIWGDSPGCSPDDDVGDTPLQDVETYGSPTPPLTDQCTPNPPGIMFMNFMDYVNDDTYSNFTPGQKTRMHACFAPNGPLYQLSQSNVCGSVTPLQADFTADQTTVPVGGTVNFTDLSTGNPTNWYWEFQGGTPSTSNQQNPSVQYNTPGVYWVKLKVSNSTAIDSITKYNYIEVYNPNAVVADFTADKTVILKGETVNFTDLSLNEPTSWQWQFPGGTPPFSNLKNPSVQYNTPGTYSVTLTVSNSLTSDSKTKENYIKVYDSTDAPKANFTSNFTTIPVNSTVDFINLSTGYYEELLWIFEGGDPPTSTNENPTGITYNSIGDYDVTLILYSPLGNDTLIKEDYIHVVDLNNVTPVKANFEAITPRLIVQGGNVSFKDKSIGLITNWKWIFEGGNPNISNLQNPFNITYSTPGIYDVTLIVSNGIYTDSLVKEDYIVVTTEPWPNPYGFCDTVTNVKENEFPLQYLNLYPNKWGYIPGHNGYLIKFYADKVVNYMFDNVRALIVPVAKAYAANPNNKVRFIIWDYDTTTGLPGSILAYKDVKINEFNPYLYHPILFDQPIKVNGKFFVGFQLYYNNPVDTFVIYLTPNKNLNRENTFYLKKGENWMSLTQFFNDTLKYPASLGIRVVGCVVGVGDLYLKEDILIYPNPFNEYFYIQLIENEINKDNIEIYNVLGQKIDAPIYEIEKGKIFNVNASNLKPGIYMVTINLKSSKVIYRINKL